jgi:hypothetical protein
VRRPCLSDLHPGSWELAWAFAESGRQGIEDIPREPGADNVKIALEYEAKYQRALREHQGRLNVSSS